MAKRLSDSSVYHQFQLSAVFLPADSVKLEQVLWPSDQLTSKCIAGANIGWRRSGKSYKSLSKRFLTLILAYGVKLNISRPTKKHDVLCGSI